jgi:hypothetical protein
MSRKGTLDVRVARDRRRFYLDRGLRKQSCGSGSDLAFLMSLPLLSRTERRVKDIFASLPVMLIGARAAASYAPERSTRDTDYLVDDRHFRAVEEKLEATGFTKARDLLFPNAALGLFGSAWTSATDEGQEVDLVASPQGWARAAFDSLPIVNADGERVIPLPFLILMKLDSARAIDQGDLSRMLGRLSDSAVEEIVSIVERYYNDPAAGDDVRQYALLGRWEYEN